MQVARAEHAGSCYGVRNALNLAEKALQNGKSTCSLGSLIHNPVEVKRLAGMGLEVVESPGEITAEQVVIRSHGVTPKVYSMLSERNCEVIDATCPHVLRAQKAAVKLAMRYDCVVVIGDAGHPEVEALKSYIELHDSKPYVCDSDSDIPHNLPREIGAVVQTTQTKETTESILKRLKECGCSVEFADTICAATQHRQTAAVNLSKTVDAMIVIGGKNSANTRHLVDLCNEYCGDVFHIETVEDIDIHWFDHTSVVGLSAGASTPEYQLAEVEEFLKSL